MRFYYRGLYWIRSFRTIFNHNFNIGKRFGYTINIRRLRKPSNWSRGYSQ